MVKHVLQYCSLDNVTEDTAVEGEQSPKEGKYSVNLNQYLSFINRNQHQREIDQFLAEIFEAKSEMELPEFVHVNKNVSSEMFCAIMAVLFQYIPCTKSIHRLRKKFKESRTTGRPGSGGNNSTGLASPRHMGQLKKFVDQGGLSPKNQATGEAVSKTFGSLADKVGTKGRKLQLGAKDPLTTTQGTHLNPGLSK